MRTTEKKASRSGLVLWISVAVAFLVLIGAWTTLITLASKNAPESVPLESE